MSFLVEFPDAVFSLMLRALGIACLHRLYVMRGYRVQVTDYYLIRVRTYCFDSQFDLSRRQIVFDRLQINSAELIHENRHIDISFRELALFAYAYGMYAYLVFALLFENNWTAVLILFQVLWISWPLHQNAWLETRGGNFDLFKHRVYTF